MAKKKIAVVHECRLCINSREKNKELHCKTMMFDKDTFNASSKVSTKIECGYYKEKK